MRKGSKADKRMESNGKAYLFPLELASQVFDTAPISVVEVGIALLVSQLRQGGETTHRLEVEAEAEIGDTDWHTMNTLLRRQDWPRNPDRPFEAVGTGENVAGGDERRLVAPVPAWPASSEASCVARPSFARLAQKVSREPPRRQADTKGRRSLPFHYILASRRILPSSRQASSSPFLPNQGVLAR